VVLPGGPGGPGGVALPALAVLSLAPALRTRCDWQVRSSRTTLRHRTEIFRTDSVDAIPISCPSVSFWDRSSSLRKTS
jgi:hypothetical protein